MAIVKDSADSILISFSNSILVISPFSREPASGLFLSLCKLEGTQCSKYTPVEDLPAFQVDPSEGFPGLIACFHEGC